MLYHCVLYIALTETGCALLQLLTPLFSFGASAFWRPTLSHPSASWRCDWHYCLHSFEVNDFLCLSHWFSFALLMDAKSPAVHQETAEFITIISFFSSDSANKFSFILNHDTEDTVVDFVRFRVLPTYTTLFIFILYFSYCQQTIKRPQPAVCLCLS